LVKLGCSGTKIYGETEHFAEVSEEGLVREMPWLWGKNEESRGLNEGTGGIEDEDVGALHARSLG
jgi:hypothetical protein